MIDWVVGGGYWVGVDDVGERLVDLCVDGVF